MTTDNKGWVRQRWEQLFGSQDDTERAVRELQRQGSVMAKVANVVSTFMVVLVSAATVITLGISTMGEFVSSVQQGHPNLVLGMALAILFMLVLCMDVAMLYGAMVIRLLSSRMAHWRAQAVHWTVVVGVAIVEGCTYYGMVQTYEHPTTQFMVTLAYARSFLAPALAIYLATARALPVTPGDILNLANLRSGISTIKHVAERTANGTAMLPSVAIFQASSQMNGDDERRMEQLFHVIKFFDGAPQATLTPLTDIEAEALPQLAPNSVPKLPETTLASIGQRSAPHQFLAPSAAPSSQPLLARMESMMAVRPRIALPAMAAELGIPVADAAALMARVNRLAKEKRQGTLV